MSGISTGMAPPPYHYTEVEVVPRLLGYWSKESRGVGIRKPYRTYSRAGRFSHDVDPLANLRESMLKFGAAGERTALQLVRMFGRG